MFEKYKKVYKADYEKWYKENEAYRQRVAADQDRLKFHLMPKTGWLNDPNGICQFDGTYHIYYQYTPFEPTGELKTWGHYTTKDFIHYKDYGPVVFPDEDIDAHGVYSGSAFIENGTIHYFYTGNLKYFDRDDYDYIIITKSTKDRVSLDKQLWMMRFLYGGTFPYNIGVINIPAENYRLSTAEYYWLYNKLAIKDSKRLICLMDNDKSGYLEAIYLRDEFGMLPIYIPKIYNAKDFFELRSIYGFNKCKEFIIETYNKINDYVTRNQSIRNKETNDIMPF